MIDLSFTSLVFAAGLLAGATLDLLLLRTYLAPPFRIWPTPEPGSWQSLTFWGLFRGGMVAAFAVAVLDWNSAGLLDASRYLIGLPLFLVGFGITVMAFIASAATRNTPRRSPASSASRSARTPGSLSLWLR
jgi:hypothetical protein